MVPKEVLKGAALLDANFKGWESRIKVDQLVMWDINRCMLGQLYFSFLTGCRTLGLTPETTNTHGFTATGRGAEEDMRLRRAWVELIQARRVPVSVGDRCVAKVAEPLLGIEVGDMGTVTHTGEECHTVRWDKPAHNGNPRHSSILAGSLARLPAEVV